MKEKLKNPKVKIALGVIVIVLIIIIGMAISNNIQRAKTKKELENTMATISQTLGGTISQTQDATISDTIKNTNNENTKKEYAQVTVGQTITIEDYLEYSFIETKFTDRINPTTPDSYYHYYEAKSEGCTLIAVKTKIKNLEAEEFSGENIPKATILYNEKYKYDCTLIVEEDDGSDLEGYDWYMDIQPLKSKTFYYYAEIPKEVETDNNPLVFRIELKENAYELKIK